MNLLFDGNTLIYQLNGELNTQGKSLLKGSLIEKGAYSIISKIEVIGFQQSEAIEKQARKLLSGLMEISLISEIAEQIFLVLTM